MTFMAIRLLLGHSYSMEQLMKFDKNNQKPLYLNFREHFFDIMWGTTNMRYAYMHGYKYMYTLAHIPIKIDNIKSNNKNLRFNIRESANPPCLTYSFRRIYNKFMSRRVSILRL